MKSLTGLALAVASMRLGIDLAREPDRTTYWPHKPKTKSATKDRTKIKAARKQRAKP